MRPNPACAVGRPRRSRRRRWEKRDRLLIRMLVEVRLQYSVTILTNSGSELQSCAPCLLYRSSATVACHLRARSNPDARRRTGKAEPWPRTLDRHGFPGPPKLFRLAQISAASRVARQIRSQVCADRRPTENSAWVSRYRLTEIAQAADG
jgi:hypothetical protein